jgi:uncharacterized caspase-like protein
LNGRKTNRRAVKFFELLRHYCIATHRGVKTGDVRPDIGSGERVSQEGENWGGGHGVFTWYLLEVLKGKADVNGDGYVTADELFPYIYENVIRDTGGHQHPANLSSEYDPKLPLANTPK